MASDYTQKQDVQIKPLSILDSNDITLLNFKKCLFSKGSLLFNVSFFLMKELNQADQS